MRADFNDGLDGLDNGAKPARGSSSSRLSTRRCRTGDISRTRCDVESAKEIGSTEPRWAEVDPQQLVVTERLQWPLAKYNGRSFSDSADGLSAFAVIQVMTSVRRLRVAFLPFADRWPRMSGLTVSECLLPTRFGHPTLSREWRRMTAKQPFRVTHISLNFDVRFAALKADRNQFSNAVAACELVL